MWVWPVSCCGCSRRTTWCVAVQNGTKGSAIEKGLCAASADRLTQPLPASDPLLTGSPVCQGRKKRKQRGSVHPGAEHRTLFILSPMLLPASPLLASGWLYFKIHKYSPLWGIEINWTLIPSFQWCLTVVLCQCCPQAGEVKRAGVKYLPDVCLSGTATPLACVLLHKEGKRGARVIDKRTTLSWAKELQRRFMGKWVL